MAGGQSVSRRTDKFLLFDKLKYSCIQSNISKKKHLE